MKCEPKFMKKTCSPYTRIRVNLSLGLFCLYSLGLLHSPARRLKGWFPRQCAVEVAGSKGSRSCTEASSSYADHKKYK